MSQISPQRRICHGFSLLLLSRFSRVRLCATPQTAATRLPQRWDSPGKNTGVGCHFLLQCMKVKSESEVTQSCPTLCDPMDCRLPGSSIHGIFEARVLEWGAIAFSRFSSADLKSVQYMLPMSFEETRTCCDLPSWPSTTQQYRSSEAGEIGRASCRERV